MKKVIPIIFAILLLIGTSGGITQISALTPPHKGIDYSDEVAWQQEHMWNLGKNLTVGDSYTYKICDLDAILNYSAESYHFFTKNLEHNGSLCYTIQMDFVNLVSTDENQISGDIWIVQAAITDDFTGDMRNSVFHVNAESFEVRSADTIHPDTIRYADSIEDTIFSIHKYTAIQSKLLQPGANWGEVTEYHQRGQNPYMMVLDDVMKWDVSPYHFEILKTKTVTEQKEIDVFSVGYEVDIVDASDSTLDEKKKKIKKDVIEDTNNVTNNYLVNSHLPFPVSGLHYNPSYNIEPHKEYEFELITYLETKSNRPPQVSTGDDDIKVDVVPDDGLPITERGTIELTFPDDVIPDDIITNDDDPIPNDTVPNDTNNDDEGPDVILNPDDDVIPDDDVTTNNNVQSDQNDSTIPMIAILVIVLVTVGIVLWKRPSFQWKKKKNQNFTRKKIAFNDKIRLEIDTEQ